MSDTPPAPPLAMAASSEPLVPLNVFARAIGPRMGPMVLGSGRTIQTALPGDPEEVWLKLLAIRHPNERHSLAGWRALIDAYRDEPAHPSHPDFVR